MPFTIEPTTAEHIVSVVDAVLLRPMGASEQYVADFCQLPIDPARRALVMAEQLGMVQGGGSGYLSAGMLARYLISASERQRAAVFRLVIEQYEPFRVFRSRLALSEAPVVAADRVRVVCSVVAHRETVKDTLISLGSFAHALKSEGAGVYRVAEEDVDVPSYVAVVGSVCETLEKARFFVTRRLGDAAQQYLVAANGMDDLATAYMMLATSAETRSPVMYAGNSIESLLVKYAVDKGVSLTGATGISSKAERLSQHGHLKAKHRAMFAYLGHVRNAADHGVDPDIGQQWEISQSTAIEYVHVAVSAVVGLVALAAGRYLV